MFYFLSRAWVFILSFTVHSHHLETCIGIDNSSSPSSRLNRKDSVGFTLKFTITIVWAVTVKQQNINLLPDKTDT